MKRIGICLLCLLSYGTVPALPGDELTVSGDVVNLRGGPSLDAPVLLQLRQGHELVEIRRVQDWVQVDTGREDVDSGWIYSELVSTTTAADDAGETGVGNAADELFDLFRQALSEYNARKRREFGHVFFSGAAYAGEGVIIVTANRQWLDMPMEQRMDDLSDVFEIWAAAVGEGRSITINVVDNNNEKLMTMFR